LPADRCGRERGSSFQTVPTQKRNTLLRCCLQLRLGKPKSSLANPPGGEAARCEHPGGRFLLRDDPASASLGVKRDSSERPQQGRMHRESNGRPYKRPHKHRPLTVARRSPRAPAIELRSPFLNGGADDRGKTRELVYVGAATDVTISSTSPPPYHCHKSSMYTIQKSPGETQTTTRRPSIPT
jgi:hypothetical protein